MALLVIQVITIGISDQEKSTFRVQFLMVMVLFVSSIIFMDILKLSLFKLKGHLRSPLDLMRKYDVLLKLDLMILSFIKDILKMVLIVAGYLNVNAN